MFKSIFGRNWNNSRGDTLVEVTFALAILAAVLLSSTVVAMTAFRTGQAAKERTQLAIASQGQVEALRSFRDNHTWAEFRDGSSPSYLGVDSADVGSCTTGQCFHMELLSTGPSAEWVPRPGPATAGGPAAANVPTSTMEIYVIPCSARQCVYDFILKYHFTTLGGGTPSNQIATKLTNLRFDPKEFPGVICS
jgi:type II secretory pathway pseudopilin PulG